MSTGKFIMKVLVVEDDEFSRKYFDNISTVSGCETRVANDGEEGLRIFEEFDPDLIISDIQMPVMDGLEMIEEVRKKKSDAVVIMATAFDSEEYAIKALQLGANNYLKKPIHAENLKRLLTKYYNILKSRSIASDLILDIQAVEFSKKFKSDIDSIPLIVEHLIKETQNVFEDNERIGLELGLAELITNSVEHGNLGISYEQKSKALENNSLPDLVADRLTDPEIAKRGVSVKFTLNEDFCEWIIEDEGEGFDWKSVKDPLESESILKLHGRGIFISKFQFDELEYIGKGNIVRVKKYRNKSVISEEVK